MKRLLEHRWLLAGFLAFLLLGGNSVLLFYFGIERLSSESSEPVKPFISLERPLDYAEMTREQASLMDSAPLFIPTEWSASREGPMISGPLHDDLFGAFAPEIVVDKVLEKPDSGFANADLYMPQVLSGNEENFIYALGRSPELSDAGTSAAKSVVHYDVRDPDGGKIVASGTFDADASLSGGVLWQPAVFWMGMAPSGRLGPVTVVSGSGVDEVDSALQRLLDSSAVLALLPPGYYRITVGP